MTHFKIVLYIDITAQCLHWGVDSNKSKKCLKRVKDRFMAPVKSVISTLKNDTVHSPEILHNTIIC